MLESKLLVNGKPMVIRAIEVAPGHGLMLRTDEAIPAGSLIELPQDGVVIELTRPARDPDTLMPINEFREAFEQVYQPVYVGPVRKDVDDA